MAVVVATDFSLSKQEKRCAVERVRIGTCKRNWPNFLGGLRSTIRNCCQNPSQGFSVHRFRYLEKRMTVRATLYGTKCPDKKSYRTKPRAPATQIDNCVCWPASRCEVSPNLDPLPSDRIRAMPAIRACHATIEHSAECQRWSPNRLWVEIVR